MNQEEFVQYERCKIKISKACKDVEDAIKELSPNNLKLLKQEMSLILPAGLKNFIQFLNN